MGNCTHTIQPSYQPESAGEMILGGLHLLARGSRLALIAAVDRLLGWAEEKRQLRVLLSYDDRTLADLGMSRADAYRIARGETLGS